MKELEMARPTQKEMETNDMLGKSGLVSHNQNSRPATLRESITGTGKGNDKKGGKKIMDIGKKMKRVMGKVMS